MSRDRLLYLDDLIESAEKIQQEIIEHLEAALMAFRDVAAGLSKGNGRAERP